MVTAKTIQTVLNMIEDGVNKSEIAEKCGASVLFVEGLIEAKNKNKVVEKGNNKDKSYVNAEAMSLWTIANELDCESDNIYGIANLLFCAGNSVGELSAEALYALGNNLFDICEKIKNFSESIEKLQKDKVLLT